MERLFGELRIGRDMDPLEKLRGVLPRHVIDTLHMVLKKDTIEKLAEMDARHVTQVIEEAVDEINRGSKEELDVLIRRKLG